MPELTKQKIESLFNVPYDNIVTYNHLDRSLSPQTMEGIVVAGYSIDSVANAFRFQCEQMPQMQERQLVLSAVRGIPVDAWNGSNHFQTTNLTDRYSQCIAGNIIVFNPGSGKFEANPDGWFGLNIKPEFKSGQYHGLHNFMFRLWLCEQERKKFIAPFYRQK